MVARPSGAIGALPSRSNPAGARKEARYRAGESRDVGHYTLFSWDGFPSGDNVPRARPWRDDHRVEAMIEIREFGMSGKIDLRSGGDPPPCLGTDRRDGIIRICPHLDLDERDDRAATGNKVDFSHGCPVPPADDAIPLEPKVPCGDVLGEATGTLGATASCRTAHGGSESWPRDLVKRRPDASARARP
jgi:hypothetical protein